VARVLWVTSLPASRLFHQLGGCSVYNKSREECEWNEGPHYKV
jgi:hypothetical protein